jgi:integrase
VARRGHGEGSIRKRADGRWEARFSGNDGRRRSLFAASRREAQEALTRALRERELGLDVDGDRQTVAQYLHKWLDGRRGVLAAGSMVHYESVVRRRIVPGIGDVRLVKLTPQRVQAFYGAQRSAGASEATVEYVHRVLRAALRSALKLGLVVRVATDGVESPRVRPREMHVWNEEQARAFLAACRGTQFEALFVVALACGMRLGELTGLRWADVDLDAGVVEVRSQVQFRRGAWYRQDLKSVQSRRAVELGPSVIRALRAHRGRQAAQRLEAGAAWRDEGLVFPDEVGSPVAPWRLREREMSPAVKAAGVPVVRFHDLRHTAATLMRARGVGLDVVSRVLGHSSIRITGDVYGHMLPEMRAQAARAMEGLFTGRAAER